MDTAQSLSCVAPYLSDADGRSVFIVRFLFSVPYLQLAPPHTWEHGRWVDYLQLLTDSPRSATRTYAPGCWCVISPHSIVMLASALFRAKSVARRRLLTPLLPCGEQQRGSSARPGAFPDVARMGGNVPAVLVCDCQATGERCFDRLSLNSPGKMPFYIALIKISLIFSKSCDTVINCQFRYTS